MSEHRELPNDSAAKEMRRRYLDSLVKVRPVLHRFCARMCGSVLDGEDLVQETVAAASYRVAPENAGFLEPSLFMMAHERCKYFIRFDLGHREHLLPRGDELSNLNGPRLQWARTPIDEALAARVNVLQPFERAAVVLKDVLEYSLLETEKLLGTTVGHVKIALFRARIALRELPPPSPSAPIDAKEHALLNAFAECFNRLDASAMHRLVSADARVEIVGAFSGRMRDLESVYAGTYAAMPWEWAHSAARVDGDPALITSRREAGGWRPYSAIRLWWEDGRVVRIRDYMQIHHLLRDARIEPAS